MLNPRQASSAGKSRPLLSAYMARFFVPTSQENISEEFVAVMGHVQVVRAEPARGNNGKGTGKASENALRWFPIAKLEEALVALTGIEPVYLP